MPQPRTSRSLPVEAEDYVCTSTSRPSRTPTTLPPRAACSSPLATTPGVQRGPDRCQRLNVKTVTWTDEVGRRGGRAHTVESPSKEHQGPQHPEAHQTARQSPTLALTASSAMRDAIRSRSSRTRLPPAGEKENKLRLTACPSRLRSSTRWTPTTSSPSLRARPELPVNLAARGAALDTWLPASRSDHGAVHRRPAQAGQRRALPVSPWLWTPSPASSRSRSPRMTSTLVREGRRQGRRASRPSSSPIAACLPSVSPSVVPRPSTTWSRTPR